MNKEERKKVKCKSYYWGFCKETKADKDGNRDYCKQEECKKFKLK